MVKVSYNKLWKILIDRKMKKIELRRLSKISGYNIAKLTHDEIVTVDVLARISMALNVKMDDLVEILSDEIPEKNHNKKKAE